MLLSLTGWKLIHNNFSTSDGPFLFISTFYNEDGLVWGAGFFISRSNFNILLAGSGPIAANSQIEAKLKTINMAALACMDNRFSIKHILVNNVEVCRVLNTDLVTSNWQP